MKQSIFIILSLLLIEFSCQKNQKKIVNPVDSNSTANTDLTSKSVPSLVKLLKADEAFIKASSIQKPYLMITDSIWSFYFALSLSEETPKENIYKGHWLDLREDGSYAKGIYEQTTDEGRYLYDYIKKTVEIRSTQKDSSSEWAVKVDPDALLLIGTDKFNNNPWQIKLLRKSNYPKIGFPLKNDK